MAVVVVTSGVVVGGVGAVVVCVVGCVVEPVIGAVVFFRMVVSIATAVVFPLLVVLVLLLRQETRSSNRWLYNFVSSSSRMASEEGLARLLSISL